MSIVAPKQSKRILNDFNDARNTLKDFGIHIALDDDNILMLHVLYEGPPKIKTNMEYKGLNGAFEGGIYHGVFDLTPFPQGPPSINMYTESGRFGTTKKYPPVSGDGRICTTFSSFHSEKWNSCTTISLLAIGFLSMFEETADEYYGVNGTKKSYSEIQEYAKKSVKRVIKSDLCQRVFPDIVEELENGTFEWSYKKQLGEVKIKHDVKKYDNLSLDSIDENFQLD